MQQQISFNPNSLYSNMQIYNMSPKDFSGGKGIIGKLLINDPQMGDIHLVILNNLNISGVKSLGATNKYWSIKANDGLLWKKIGMEIEPDGSFSTKHEMKRLAIGMKFFLEESSIDVPSKLSGLFLSEDVESLKIFKKFSNAFSQLGLWASISRHSADKEFFSFGLKRSSNVEEFLFAAEQFRPWCIRNQADLSTSIRGLNVFHLLGGLPSEIEFCTNITELSINSSFFLSPALEIQHLTQLHTLKLNFNNFSTLPPEILHLTQLQKLRLRGNQLSTLPPEIQHLTGLHMLNLSRNNFSTFPLEIQHLTQLHTLDLHGNNCSTLPPEIQHLTQLQTLDLTGNNFSTLPSEIQHLPQLRRLDLSFNGFNVLPSEIQHMTQLHMLNLAGNPIGFYDKIWLQGLERFGFIKFHIDF